jgi:YD repeat-containing protein
LYYCFYQESCTLASLLRLTATWYEYTYDANGNTRTQTSGGTRTTYTWDDENRLIGATVTDATGNQQMQYRNDVDGIRVASTVNGQQTRYLVDANRDYAQVLEEYTPNGTAQVSYVYGNDLISQQPGGTQTFYHVKSNFGENGTKRTRRNWQP